MDNLLEGRHREKGERAVLFRTANVSPVFFLSLERRHQNGSLLLLLGLPQQHDLRGRGHPNIIITYHHTIP